MTIKNLSRKSQYKLKSNGNFDIEDYNNAKSFSNFFPGIAGVWGIPMWAFYVNRGQCIASFGVESKDKAITEFQPANKSYRLTSLQGFRTFVKLVSGSKSIYWEPFQNHLMGTNFKKTQILSMSAHDMTICETNIDLGLTIEVNYFTLPEEPYSALVRRVTIKNTGNKNYDIELLDGLPAIVPYGLTDGLIKNMARTAEAWVGVRNLKKKAPYYQLNVEVSDKPEVTHIEEGNFFFSFDPRAKNSSLLEPIVQADHIFGESCDFLAPIQFIQKSFKLPGQQRTNNRTPTAMSYARFKCKPKSEREIISLFGFAHSISQLNGILRLVRKKNHIERKAERNKIIIDGIKNMCLTNSSSNSFDLYASHTFLDNILRGGLPVSLKTGEGSVAFNVYSRKHGDLERDYNHFVVSPTFYSQGNGNYRDVNQNRRNDIWFNKDVKCSHLISFLSLIQADGYNPLIVKGAAFSIDHNKKIDLLCSKCVVKKDQVKVKEFLKETFLPGELLKFIMLNEVRLKVSSKEFLANILEISHKHDLADYGEGFWSDHWTYNLDLLESYFSVYPDELKKLLLGEPVFRFYHNVQYVLPRECRYILTDRGVRQYESVANGAIITSNQLRTKNGQGDVYYTNLLCKLLCLIANKVASLDPSGVGIEMEADKPNWYDALNGLPGLLGSSISETIEMKRLGQFLLDSLNTLKISDNQNIEVFEELSELIGDLINALSEKLNAYEYWQKSNELKEQYRESVRDGIAGTEKSIAISEIRSFLSLVISKTDKAIKLSTNSKGYLATYFTHEVVKHKIINNGKNLSKTYVQPLNFKRRALPLFLEGYVHALRVEKDIKKARSIYEQVRRSELFDKKLKMYKVCGDLSAESEEIGRARIFPAGWLENESIWLHMEYKFLLELLRCGLVDEFYQNFRSVLVPFFKPEQYGRSVLENSSFLVSSAHEDNELHGRGFVARLSGSTAEFVHIWLLMNVGKSPFTLNSKGHLEFTLRPLLPKWLFTTAKSKTTYLDSNNKAKVFELPKNTYAFNLFESTWVVYYNPNRRNTFGTSHSTIKEMQIFYKSKKKPVVYTSGVITGSAAHDIRDRKVARINAFFT